MNKYFSDSIVARQYLSLLSIEHKIPLTGQCQCKTNTQGRRCDTCTDATYSLDVTSPDGCKPCECYEWGVGTGRMCDQQTGACNCLSGGGDPAVTNHTCVSTVRGTVTSINVKIDVIQQVNMASNIRRVEEIGTVS